MDGTYSRNDGDSFGSEKVRDGETEKDSSNDYDGISSSGAKAIICRFREPDNQHRASDHNQRPSQYQLPSSGYFIPESQRQRVLTVRQNQKSA